LQLQKIRYVDWGVACIAPRGSRQASISRLRFRASQFAPPSADWIRLPTRD